MTECGEGAVCPDTIAPPTGPTPPAVTTGNADITVMLEAKCWDTFENGESGSNADRAVSGQEVNIQGPTGAVRHAPTNGSGVASIVEIGVGRATVTITREGWTPLTDHVEITAGGTATLTVTLHRPAGFHGCSRKHPPKPPPTGEIGEVWLGPFFWTSEPVILVLRDLLWMVLLVLSAILIPIGIAIPSQYVCLCLGAFFFALCAYVNHIIFGMILGVIVLVLAFGGFLAIVVFQIMAMMTSPPLPMADMVTGAIGLPRPDIYMFPNLCAIWFGFAGGLMAGGREFFNYYQWITIIVVAIICAVLATVIYLLMDFFTHGMQFSDWAWMAFLQFVFGLISGALGAFFGHVFINDGNLATGTTFQITDLELPFAGVRYCVQGHRGYISHFVHRYQQEVEIPNPLGAGTVRGRENRLIDQEYSYDWSLPEGTPILAAKDGHITAYKEDRTGNSMGGNDQENFIHVKHKDGSVAEYLHLKQNGVRGINAFLLDDGNRRERVTGMRNGVAPDPSLGVHYTITDPVFVYAGQRLAGVGNVGVSMFDHIHFHVVAATPDGDRAYAPIKFKDPDVASHEGRCYSMRSYRSGNLDKGPASLT